MAKGWNLVGTNAMEFGDTRTRDEKRRDTARQTKAFNRLMAKTKVRSFETMVKDAEKTYNAKQAENAALLQAFADKKLKSKALIKQAKALKKKQAENKSAKAQAKKAVATA